MYAIIQNKGRQYKVSVGDLVDLDHHKEKENSILKVTDVLLTSNDGEVKIGKPFLPGSQVNLKVVSNFKGEKVDILKFKAKSRYRKKIGFRAKLTKVKVESIDVK